MSTSGSELDQPSTQGEGYNVTSLDTASTAQQVFPTDLSSGSIIMRAAPGNAGNLFIGFDDQVTSSNGFTLEAGDVIGIDLDVDDQAIWFIGANAGDEIRWMAIN